MEKIKPPTNSMKSELKEQMEIKSKKFSAEPLQVDFWQKVNFIWLVQSKIKSMKILLLLQDLINKSLILNLVLIVS
jgi:hypothetical protein